MNPGALSAAAVLKFVCEPVDEGDIPVSSRISHEEGEQTMSLERIEQEEEDRIQYELQLTGQGGNRWKTWPGSKKGRQAEEASSVRVQSSEDYILTLEKIKR